MTDTPLTLLLPPLSHTRINASTRAKTTNAPPRKVAIGSAVAAEGMMNEGPGAWLAGLRAEAAVEAKTAARLKEHLLVKQRDPIYF